MVKKIFFRFILMIFLFAATCLVVRESVFKNTIFYTDKGFAPAGIRVVRGDTVTFINLTNRQFWPASDPHPQHSIEPTFDAQNGIGLLGKYKIFFKNDGTYRYHDHLNPKFRGVIKVIDKAVGADVSRCTEFTDKYEKKLCFLEYLEDMQLAKGDVKALSMLETIVSQNSDLKSECHSMAHNIGEIGYWSYSTNAKVINSQKVSVCGFGYVHGFMQEFAHHSPDFYSKSKSFCDYFSKEVKYDSDDWQITPEDTCYNGIGHGIVYLNFEDYRNDLVSLARTSGAKCSEINSAPAPLDHCLQGVFSGISGLYLGTHGFFLPLPDTEPLSLCTKFDKEYKLRCLANMIPVVGVIYNHNLENLLMTIKNMSKEDLEHSYRLAGDIAANWYSGGEIDSDSVAKACRKLSNPFSKYCISGFVAALPNIYGYEADPEFAMNICKKALVAAAGCQTEFLLEYEKINPDKMESVLRVLEAKDFHLLCRNPIIGKYCTYSNN